MPKEGGTDTRITIITIYQEGEEGEGRAYRLASVVYHNHVGDDTHFTCDQLVRGHIVHYDDYANKPNGAARKVQKRAYEKAGATKTYDSSTDILVQGL